MKKLICMLLAILIVGCSVCSLSGCDDGENAFLDTNKLKIVATIFPYYDFAKNIAGDKAEVKLLLSPGNEPHNYDPSPSDIVAIESCDIFIYNGGESDEWVESVLDSLENTEVVVLKMTDYVPLLKEESAEHIQGDEYDEHIWTSVRNAKRLVSVIADSVCDIDGNNADYYSDNENKYLAELERLDADFSEIVNNGVRNTVVFGDRFPFLYFTTDYKLNYECAFPGCSSETEPSISTVTHLIDFIRDNNISVVFYLDFSNEKVAKLLTEDSNAVSRQFSSCHNITKQQFEQNVSYVSLMQQNAAVLKEALS